MSVDRYENNERGVMRMLREFLDAGRLADLFGLPPILHYEEEFALTRGRCDFVLFHEDGSSTVIEAKGPGDMRSWSSGIGQLLSYTTQIGMARPLSRVRGLLVAPVKVGTEEARLLDRCCERAGMRFLPSPALADLNDNYRALVKKCRHNPLGMEGVPPCDC